MNVEEITRELHRQAAETSRWSPPTIDRLRARRTARRRRLAASAVGAALVAACAVTVVVVGHHDPGQDVAATVPPPPPASSAVPWQVERCSSRANGGCAMPEVIRIGGARYVSLAGGQQPMVAANGVNRVLTFGFNSGGARDHVLLAGAVHGGTGSRVVARLDGRLADVHVGGGLHLVLVPPHQPAHVTLRETGPVDHDEVLTIQEYAPLR